MSYVSLNNTQNSEVETEEYYVGCWTIALIFLTFPIGLLALKCPVDRVKYKKIYVLDKDESSKTNLSAV